MVWELERPRGRYVQRDCNILITKRKEVKPIRTVKAKMAGMKKSGDRIPDKVLKEIFPKKLSRFQSSDEVYTQLKTMILSGKLKKGQRLVQEKIAQKFNVSRMAVGIAFSKLKKDELIISKRGVGSFILRQKF